MAAKTTILYDGIIEWYRLIRTSGIENLYSPRNGSKIKIITKQIEEKEKNA